MVPAFGVDVAEHGSSIIVSKIFVDYVRTPLISFREITFVLSFTHWLGGTSSDAPCLVCSSRCSLAPLFYRTTRLPFLQTSRARLPTMFFLTDNVCAAAQMFPIILSFFLFAYEPRQKSGVFKVFCKSSEMLVIIVSIKCSEILLNFHLNLVVQK